MLKTIFFFLLFTAFVQSSTAQDGTLRRTSFGIKLGAAYTGMNFNKGVPPPLAPVFIKWRPGVVASAFLNVQVTDRFSVQPEYGWLTAASTRLDSGITYRLNYLSFPVLLKYRLVTALHLLGGIQFDLLLRAKKEKGSATTTITHDTEERNIGITGGLEYFFNKNISLTVRYNQGLNHVGIGQRSAVQEYKSQQVLAAAGFYF